MGEYIESEVTDMTTTAETHTLPTAGAADPAAPDDPFGYGWRYVKRDLGNGAYTVEEIPLTLEDVLHPEEGDQVTHSEAHQRRVRYLCNVFASRLAHDSSAVVLDDVRIKWDVPEVRPHGPDIMVIFGVREKQNWSTFDVAQEGTRPALIIELTSPETAGLDRSNKLEQYETVGVPLYIIIDAVTPRRQAGIRLMGYQLQQDVYQTLVPNEQGWLWLEPLHLWLGIADNEIVCYDETGQPLGDYVALRTALEAEIRARTAAEARSKTEAEARTAAEARAAAAEARLQELEAELRRLRGED
jgi:Uma2 family endonuclease